MVRSTYKTPKDLSEPINKQNLFQIVFIKKKKLCAKISHRKDGTYIKIGMSYVGKCLKDRKIMSSRPACNIASLRSA